MHMKNKIILELGSADQLVMGGTGAKLEERFLRQPYES